MTSSTPELEVLAGGVPVRDGAEVPGRGDLRVRTAGHPPGGLVELWIGERPFELLADERGVATWTGPGLLATLAGEVRVRAGERTIALRVRPDKLVAEAIRLLVADLEDLAEGLSQSAGGMSHLADLRSRDQDLSTLDRAVGLASSAAPAIRRRPIHRSREVVRAVAQATGPRAAADVRWLATHPVQAIRAAATGRAVGVRRERRADLDVLENRGVLAAYEAIGAVGEELLRLVEGEIERLERARPHREAFLTEAGSLWSERDQPRHDALVRRRAVLAALGAEVAAARTRSGLPDLRPRAPRMALTPRVAAEPAYWATFRAFRQAEEARAEQAPAAPAPVRALDELWEQWCTVEVVRAVVGALGRPPDGGGLVDPGWFATLRTGPVATWSEARRTVRVLYEPSYADGATEPRKLFPGRPWRPDVVIEIRWADGTLDLHVLDAKFRREQGQAPWSALQDVWWKYGEGIGARDGWPVVRSVWVLWPGEGVRLAGPRMLNPEWPPERLRGGTIGLSPGRSGDLRAVAAALIRRPAARSTPDGRPIGGR